MRHRQTDTAKHRQAERDTGMQALKRRHKAGRERHRQARVRRGRALSMKHRQIDTGRQNETQV